METPVRANDQSLLSEKSIEPHDRLIYALDHESQDDARRMVKELGESVRFYKLGLELMLAGNYQDMIEELVGEGKQVFVDLKFFDVPETVGAAVRQVRNLGATFVTVHGNGAMMQAAVAQKQDMKVLAVTVLTSLDRSDLDDMGFEVDVAALVLSRARHALSVGCDGVISSGLEASKLRAELGERFLIVAPGIRPVENRIMDDDQKRTVDVRTAFENGADYIVVGRPIRDTADPRQAAQEIQNTIASIFSGH